MIIIIIMMMMMMMMMTMMVIILIVGVFQQIRWRCCLGCRWGVSLGHFSSSSVSCNMELFADDSVLYRKITSEDDFA